MSDLPIFQRVTRKIRGYRVKLAGECPFTYSTAFGRRACIPSNPPLAHLYIHGSKEPDELTLAGALLEPGDLVLDIGANHGLYTMLAASRKADVIAVEADSRLCKILEELQKFFPESKISTINSVVGDSVGSSEFWLCDEAGEHYRQSVFKPSRKFVATEMPCTTVDALVSSAGKQPSLVKIDVEGAELACLHGAVNTLTTGDCRTWIVEISRRHLEQQGHSPCDILSFFEPSRYHRFAVSLCEGTDGSGHHYQELRHIADQPKKERLPWLFNMIAISRDCPEILIPKKFRDIKMTTG